MILNTVHSLRKRLWLERDGSSVYSVTPHSLHPRSWYTSYRQFSVVVCPVVSGDPRQRQHILHEVAPMMCTVEAVWLDQSIYSVDSTKDQEFFRLSK